MMQHDSNNRRSNRFRRYRRKRLFLVLAGLALCVFGLVRLISYGTDLFASRRNAQALRALYDEVTPPAPTAGAMVPLPGSVMAFAQLPEETAAPLRTPEPLQPDRSRLPKADYPFNPKAEVSSRFKALQKESRYIVGWLNAKYLIDEPVAQRDDVFFLNHDVYGNENVNGAVFLDAAVSLRTRPYTYILYGHNMKSGAMFGNLRNYENRSYYHGDPFIRFDTLYEEGRYVIFAVSSISTEPSGSHYVDFYDLRSTDISARQQAIETIIDASVHTCTIDVRPEDQLLLLVTCVDKSDERRVVAARRIRDGENENELLKAVGQSVKK